MNTRALFVAATMAVAGMGVLGCEGEVETRNDGTTGARVEADRAAVDRAADSTARAAGNTAAAADRAVERTGDALSDAGDRAQAGMNNAAADARTAADRATGGDETGPVTDAINRIDATVGEGPNAPGHAGDSTDVSGARTAADRGANAGDRDATRGTVAPNGTAQAPDAEAIRDTFASVAEAAVKKGTFDDLVERFVDADRNRIGDFAEQDMADLDAKVDQFAAAWQAKYGTEFDITNEEMVFGALRIQQSEIGDNARAAAGGVDVDVNRRADRADVSVDNRTGVDSPANQAADANRNDPGRNIASVTFPASHGMPDLNIPLIHEFPDVWKIDVPDSVDGPRLKQNLMAHLDAALGMQAQWPATADQAYAAIAHHVLMAVMDKPVAR